PPGIPVFSAPKLCGFNWALVQLLILQSLVYIIAEIELQAHSVHSSQKCTTSQHPKLQSSRIVLGGRSIKRTLSSYRCMLSGSFRSKSPGILNTSFDTAIRCISYNTSGDLHIRPHDQHIDLGKSVKCASLPVDSVNPRGSVIEALLTFHRRETRRRRSPWLVAAHRAPPRPSSARFGSGGERMRSQHVRSVHIVRM
ncbi:hypothetical protein C8F04DRAFT_1168517, partial [Mycena alexandri]